jgi:8-oxo-dGTP pyrophosphatase MutT (NUDIX family)
MQEGTERVRALITGIVPADELEQAHRSSALAWLDGTRDIYRRAKPATPPQHLVSYTVLADSADLSVFLVDHVRARLWLPPGGHVEPGEDPAATARRETREELGIEADFSIAGDQPVFITVTRTAGLDPGHTDVSLWYVISGSPRLSIALDPAEFNGGRWWTAKEIESASPANFDPHFGRFTRKLRSVIGAGHDR